VVQSTLRIGQRIGSQSFEGTANADRSASNHPSWAAMKISAAVLLFFMIDGDYNSR
jgi:hypothetical protein